MIELNSTHKMSMY